MTRHEVKRFEDPKGVSIQVTVFWDVMPYTLVDRYRPFGRTCCHLPLRRQRQQVPPKCWYLSTEQHGDTSAKTVIWSRKTFQDLETNMHQALLRLLINSLRTNECYELYLFSKSTINIQIIWVNTDFRHSRWHNNVTAWTNHIVELSIRRKYTQEKSSILHIEYSRIMDLDFKASMHLCCKTRFTISWNTKSGIACINRYNMSSYKLHIWSYNDLSHQHKMKLCHMIAVLLLSTFFKRSVTLKHFKILQALLLFPHHTFAWFSYW
jgi:hypothetical protein